MRVGVACIVKNESPYILEWVAHYHLLGFDKIIVGDNLSSDDTLLKLRHLARMGTIDVHRFDHPSGKPQVHFYDHVSSLYSDQLDVLCFFDADEFIFHKDENINPRNEISNLFRDHQVSAVAINWCIYGSSSEKEFRNELLTRRFLKHSTEKFGANKHYKCAVRLESMFGMLNPHHPSVMSGKIINAEGNVVEYEKRDCITLYGLSHTVSWNNLRINHYFCKSEQEFREIKMPRGLADSTGMRSMSHFHAHDKNDRCDFSVDKHATKIADLITCWGITNE
ncbi:MAG: glycosyltransferase family 2 protein [Halothiobacillaceae bacterium]|nr:glycosyltransferase family 2 protein [Halothiobacillaceae bacterium]